MEGIILLAIVFFIVAFAYASVGLGGGSSYTALLALFGLSTAAIPLISLSLNIIVTTVGSVNFLRNHHGRWRLILPFLLTAMPMAYIGGMWAVEKTVFYGLLFVSLLFVAIRIYFWPQVSIRYQFTSAAKWAIALFAGVVLGLVAGIVGIGGGIFLVPLIIILGLGSEKEAAACGAVFIWCNSVAGLLSRMQYQNVGLLEYWPLLIAVLLGGIAGSFLGAFKLKAKTMDQILGVVVLVALVFLAQKLWT